MNTKDAVTIKELLEIIKHFPGYTVFGNKPYEKNTLIIRLPDKKRQSLIKPVLPYIVASFPNNYTAKRVMVEPGWNPGAEKSITEQLELFPINAYSNQLHLMKLFLRKIIDCGVEYNEGMRLFGVKSLKELKTLNKKIR